MPIWATVYLVLFLIVAAAEAVWVVALIYQEARCWSGRCGEPTCERLSKGNRREH